MRRTNRLLVVPAVATLVAGLLAAGGPAEAGRHDPPSKHGSGHGPDLVVMTQNLYLGSSLDAALAAQTGPEFVAATAQIYGTAVASDFPRRAEAIADTIARKSPDLIGLQEVTRWTATPLKAGANPPSYDFLAILLGELAERGLSYRVAGVSDNADIGPVPLIAPQFGCVAVTSPTSFDCAVGLQDRDVILENTRTRHLDVGPAVSGRYAAQQTFPIPDSGGAVLDFGRGWVYVDATLRGSRFRFVNTHLEVGEFGAVQEAQGAEFLAGPARTSRPVIATGDFNSPADPRVSTTSTYADLTRDWFDDAWWVNRRAPGFTCCQGAQLANPTSSLRTRIDLVLTRGIRKVRWAKVVGDRPISAIPPRWASDHAGVVAGLQLRAGHRHGHR
ncbi:endonuclease/exonuclease/phosphatase family protein [Nocardioides sp. W7]|uniref:endonuclease/exonuclease/phosphatase family protein n=1 Tax=Nocardioides sp. W7 TaxID=2931390 RepID=UPI001FD30521|nr:endonuclease/exonuclease/phosphatase family protein [Nocardioides sp. W7]